jgi:hypothetical protein
MNKIGIAALATAVISSAALANDNIVGEIVLGKNNMIGTGLKLPKLNKDTDLYSTDWSNFTVGGAVGQDLWTNFGGSTAAFNITATRPGGQAGKGYNQTQSGTSSRFFYRDLSAEFAGRGAGENIVWTESSMFNKAANTQRGRGSMFTYDYDATASYITSGMRMDVGTGTSYTQGKIQGGAYLTAAAAGGTAGNYVFTFNTGTNTGPVPTAGSWVYFASNRNFDTGRVEWYYSVDGGVSYTGFFYEAGVRAINSVIDFNYITAGAASSSSFNVDFGSMAVYTVPAPGAAALVGLAGLVSRRRR